MEEETRSSHPGCFRGMPLQPVAASDAVSLTWHHRAADELWVVVGLDDNHVGVSLADFRSDAVS